MERITIEDNEEYLRKISKEIDFNNDDIKTIINDLKEYCQNSELYALAPVQVGIPKRLIYIRNTTQDMSKNNKDYNEEIIYINPIIKNMYGHTKFLEACGSCKYKDGNYIAAIVDRPYKIEIEYYDLNNKKNNKVIEGFESTIFCHEYDHLNGILHMDRVDSTQLLTLDEMRKYRSNNPYQVISKTDIFIYKNNNKKQLN